MTGVQTCALPIFFIGLRKPKVYVYLFGIGEPNELLLNKEVEKEKPNPRKLHKDFFLKPYPPPTKERVLAAFLVRLWVL